ncbi:peptide-N-glycosidase F-related protein [Sinomicrobium sp. M5D2P9]
MKQLLLIALFYLGTGGNLFAQQIHHVISHKGETVVTDPSKGTNSYPKWTVFPDRKEDIRSVILRLTFECPDGMRCADWDYLDHVIVRQTGGAKGDTLNYEIARMLTPYGGRFRDKWKFDWKVDVTDFSSILRDSVRIDYVHTGYEDNKTRGWKVTVDFEIMKGTPVAAPAAIHKVYDGIYDYGNRENPIEDHLKPVTIKATPETAFARLKLHHTGHGMDKNGCGEFCDKYRDIKWNGKLLDRKNIWMACGENPLYPQAGTWIFDRANWCPGYLLQPDEYRIPVTAGEEYTLDVDMEPYTTDNPSAQEHITAYIIEYGKVLAKNDVTLTDILSPSDEAAHGRENPNGGLPVIRVKNNGENPLESILVKYFIEGEKQKTFKWKGNIPFGETAVITLPEEIFSAKDSVGFTVELSRPNGKKDAFPGDNRKTSVYQRPNILPKDIVIYFKTNKKPGQNSYRISDSFGKIHFKKDSTSLKPDTLYRDTLALPDGNYTFTVEDSAGNGLEFWYHTKEGRGAVKLLDTFVQAIRQFESDFGSSIRYNFAVKKGMPYRTDPKPSVAVFPARTDGPVTLDYFANTEEDVKVRITEQENEDHVLEEHHYTKLSKGNFTYDLSYLPKMRCYIQVFVKGEEIFKNRIRLKE